MENFSHSATIIPVKDMATMSKFYTLKLGFKITFEWEDPPSYVVLKRGNVSIHLSHRRDDLIISGDHCPIYIFVHDIHQMVQECKDQGIQVISELEDRDYHMKDFDIRDPEGFRITFGKGQ